VFHARVRGVSLPPIELVRGPDGYYVRDGHHRLSVARTLGQDYVEAVVMA
jgi:ParB-like chromosome segregation protein Spo0J